MGAEHARRQRQMARPELLSYGEDLARDEMEMLLSGRRVGDPQSPRAEAPIMQAGKGNWLLFGCVLLY
jgi:hypothetical protein